MRFGVLGPVSAWSNDREVALGSPKQRAVFAMLLLQSNRVVSRAQLVDGVWGDSPPDDFNGCLNSYIARLRREVPPGFIVRDAGGYRITLDCKLLDASLYDAEVRLARMAAKTGQWPEARALYAAALGRWRGEALSGVPGPFAGAERDRLAEHRRATEEDLLEVDLALGAHPDVVSRLTALLAQDPFRERRWAMLIVALHRCGRRADALRAFHSARRSLVDGLGLEPGPQLQSMQHQILNGYAPALDALL